MQSGRVYLAAWFSGARTLRRGAGQWFSVPLRPIAILLASDQKSVVQIPHGRSGAGFRLAALPLTPAVCISRGGDGDAGTRLSGLVGHCLV